MVGLLGGSIGCAAVFPNMPGSISQNVSQFDGHKEINMIPKQLGECKLGYCISL